MLEVGDAALDERLEQLGRSRIEREVVGHAASEPGRGATGAALVDEDQVPFAAHGLERAPQLQVEVDGALAGAARDQQQRVGLRRRGERRDARDEQLDGLPVGCRGVLGGP